MRKMLLVNTMRQKISQSSKAMSLKVFAPAKINLYLHVTKRLDNGYHALDSLVSFADIGDEIEISSSDRFEFSVDGPTAGVLRGRDLDAGPQSSNLVVKAVWRLAQVTGRAPDVSIHLTKHLPAGAGIGGGSSDAAAVIWGLCQLWDIPKDAGFVRELLISLGADVPICFAAETARITGIGDVFEPVPALPDIPIVLVYPGKPCSTVDVFRRFEGSFRDLTALPKDIDVQFLKRCRNDLLPSAEFLVPEIDNVLRGLDAQDGCLLSRMSGSGSCCFGLFDSESLAMHAESVMASDNPDWWVKTGWLGRTTRY